MKKVLMFFSDLFWWIFNLSVYFLKKFKKMVIRFFKSDFFKRNKWKMLAVLVVVFLVGGFFYKYKIVLIPRDINEQTSAQKTLIRSQDQQGVVQNQSNRDGGSATNQAQNTPKPTKRVVRGEVRKIEEGFIFLDSNIGEQRIVKNEKTKIYPMDVEISVGQNVTVFLYEENGELAAERIAIQPTSSSSKTPDINE